jgi:hypothetical protein
MKNKLIIFFSIILVFNIFYKFSNINTHYDEVGAVQTILSAKYYNEADVYKNFWQQKFGDSLQIGAKNIFFNNLPYIVVPIRWTYAIGFYPIIALFINDTDSISILKFKGIVGFAVLSIFGFIFFSYLLLKRFDIGLCSYIFISSVICFGLEYIHYARSATPYALIILGFSIQLYSITNIKHFFFSSSNTNRKNQYLNFFLFGLPVVFNHQFIITYPFLLIFTGYFFYAKKVNLKQIFFYLTLPSLIFLGDVLFLYVRSKMLNLHTNPGLNVSSNGLHGEYIFGNMSSIFDKISYFIKNGALFTFYSITGFYKTEYERLAYLISFLFYSFFGCILFFLFKYKKNDLNRYSLTLSLNQKILALYISINFCVFFFLIISGKLNLSPTRHSLFFSVLFCLMIGLFVGHLSKMLSFLFYFSPIVLIFFIFLNNRDKEYEESGFSPDTIFEYAKKNDCKSIVLQQCWMYPLFSNELNKEFDLLYRCGPRCWNTDISVRKSIIYVDLMNETSEARLSYLKSLMPQFSSHECVDSVIKTDPNKTGYNMYLYKVKTTN